MASAGGSLLQRSPWFESSGAPKNVDHPVNGIIDAGKSIHLYVHHNYRGAGVDAKPYVARYTIAKSSLVDLKTRVMVRAQRYLEKGRRLFASAAGSLGSGPP